MIRLDSQQPHVCLYRTFRTSVSPLVCFRACLSLCLFAITHIASGAGEVVNSAPGGPGPWPEGGPDGSRFITCLAFGPAYPRPLPVIFYRNMSRRAVYFTGAQLRAITADKLRYGYFLLAVLSILAISLTFPAPDRAVAARCFACPNR